MDEELDYSTNIYGGDNGFGGDDYGAGYGDDQPPPEPAPQAPPPATAPPPVEPQAQPELPVVPGTPPVMGGESPVVDMMTTLLRIAGGAAIGYFATDRHEERLKLAAMGAGAAYFGGAFGTLGFAYWASKQRGR